MTKNLKTCPLTKTELSNAYNECKYSTSALPKYIKEHFDLDLSRTQVERFLKNYNLNKSFHEKKMIDCNYDRAGLEQALRECDFNVVKFVQRENSPSVTWAKVMTWINVFKLDKSSVVKRTLRRPCPMSKNDFVSLVYECGFNKFEITRRFLKYYDYRPCIVRFFHSFELEFYKLKKEFLDIIENADKEFIVKTLESVDYDLSEAANLLNFPSTGVIRNIFNDNKINSFSLLHENRKLFDEMTLGKISDILEIPVCHVKEYRILSGIELNENVYLNSTGEIEVLDFIRSLGFPSASKKRYLDENDKKFEIDIVIEEKGCGFEFNGDYWHSTFKQLDKNYHSAKIKNAKYHGIELFHIFEHEWNLKKDIVKSNIKHKLGKTGNKVFARKLTICHNISSSEEKEFLTKNHIQGYVNSSVKIGLRDNDNKLMMLLTLGKPRFDRNVDWEIYRVSTQLNTVVIGGLSKLLDEFKRKFNPKTIMTYVDLRYGSGNSYELCGFVLDKITKPSYFYVKGDVILSRYQAQKHKILKMFPDTDKTLTETEIMATNRYNKIYDAGNAKLIFLKN